MLIEMILGALAVLLIGGLAIGLLVLPLIAFMRSRRILPLEVRLRELEKELRRLRRRVDESLHADDTQATVVESAPAESPEPVGAAAVVEQPAAIVAHGDRPAFDLEALIGGRGLGWIAVVLLLFAGGFFLQQVFEKGFIGELGRVAIGLAIGVTLCLAGWRFHVRGWTVFSQMLTAGGVVLLYLATFASFGFYQLLPKDHAVFFLVAIIVEAMLLAIVYEAPAIAVMAVIGGLLNPVLLHSDRDQYVGLFMYLTALNLGVVLLAWFRPAWPAICTLALLGAQALFWGWYHENYHPMKLGAAILFQAGTFLLFLAQAAVGHMIAPRKANLEDLGRLLLNAILAASAGYVLLDPRFHFWMGTFAVGLATVYALLTWLTLLRHADDPRQSLALLAIAMAFLAMVFPLQAEAAWIAVGWAVQGLALWWFGLRISSIVLRGLGVVFLVVAAGRLLIVDTPGAHVAPFIPVFNSYGVAALVVAGSLIAAALLARRLRLSPGARDVALPPALGLAGVAALWLVLSVETHDYFQVKARYVPELAAKAQAKMSDDLPEQMRQLDYEREIHLRQSAQTALSVMWAAFAAMLLAIGLRFAMAPLRWAALGLFGLTLGKVLIVDMERLPGFYRVLAFLGLSMMMAAGAWGYQKVKRSLASSAPKGGPR